MKLIDSHCHLESEELFNDLDKIIQGASKAGIVKLITCSVNYEQWDKSKSIAEKYDEVEFANGIHPWYASVSDLDRIEELADSKSRGAVAIGEIGIDKKIDNPSYEIQKEIFIRQMEIACDIDLPVILHARGTSNELYKILKSTGIPKSGGVIHSFSGSVEQAEDFIKLGLSFSIGGVLTYKKSAKRIKMLERIFPDYFLLETDSPDILPISELEGPNIPENIILNLKAVSEILGVSEEKIAEHTTLNAARIFNLKV